MSEMKFTEDHEWVRMEGDTAVIGITEYAQDQLGEIVFVELPENGRDVERGQECAVIESVKAAGELKAPISGTITAVNGALADEPERVNSDATGEGWFMRMSVADPAQLDDLMDEGAYKAYVDGLG